MEGKTIETADSGNVTETRTPETWEELTAAYPELADMPKLKPAYTFSPTETGLFTIMVTLTRFTQRELGKSTRSKTSSKTAE